MLEFVLHLHFSFLLAFDMTNPGSANELAGFFSDALDWGIAAAKGYLGFLAVTALAVHFFRG